MFLNFCILNHSFQMNHGSFIPILVLILNGVIAIIAVFIACEIGQQMNNAFNKIDFAIDQFDYYLFPLEVKRALPMVIVVAQQPVALACFGDITCTRETFKSVSFLVNENYVNGECDSNCSQFDLSLRLFIARSRTLWFSGSLVFRSSNLWDNKFSAISCKSGQIICGSNSNI